MEGILKNHFLKALEEWKDVHKRIHEDYTPDEICLIQLEDLKTDPIKSITPCVKFLGFDVTNELASCIAKNQEGNFKRPSRPQSENDFMMALMPEEIKEEYLNIKHEIYGLFEPMKKRT